MVNPVGSNPFVADAAQPAQRPTPQQRVDSPQDIVQLSQHAQQSVGDADHDGDSR